jgi:hypothetical protein
VSSPDPVSLLLSRLETGGCDPTPTGPDSWESRCPAHNGKRKNLSICRGDDGKVLVYCHHEPGCTVEAIVQALGLVLSDLFPFLTDPGRNGKAAGRPKKQRKTYAGPKEAQDALLYALGPGTRSRGWRYEGADGSLVAVVYRFDLPDGSKTYRPVHRTPAGWQIADPPDPWPLYRLPELASASHVCLTEGEKCADLARGLGLTATTSAHGAKAPHKTDWTPLAGKEVIILPDHDQAGESYAHTVMGLLARLSPRPRVRIVRLADLWRTVARISEGADLAEWIADGTPAGWTDTDRRAALEQAADAAPVVDLDAVTAPKKTRIEARPAGKQCSAGPESETADASEAGSRPRIEITCEEHIVNAEAAAVLEHDDTLYQRGGILVRVVRDASPAAKGIRRPFAPRIEALPPSLLRERLTANATWITVYETKEGPDEKPSHPPGWCVAAVHARADWPGVRHLEAVVDYPVLRPDGTILDRPGYDPETGLLLEANGPLPAVPAQPTRADAVAARDALLEVVNDFPFEQPVHRAAWLAGLLTPMGRFAFPGPAPLFLVDANVRAAGKGLLLDTISRIVTGERFSIATYTADDDELRKRVTSLALAGDRLVLFDNLEGRFGGPVLDAALTGTAWKDRILGGNRMAEAPLYMTWFATGNNVAVVADTARRVCHCRLESPDERPEERSGFRHPDLLAWVGASRGRLLAAALTLLRAYCVAGRPDQGLPAWGSFEGWSRLVRSAVVWVGLPDPGATRLLLQESADTTAESMGVLLECWERMDADRRGLTAAEAVQLYKQPPDPRPDWHAELVDALESLIGRPDARSLGFKLRSARRRNFGGRYLDRVATAHHAARWAVFPATDLRPGAKHTPHTPDTPPGPGRSGGSLGEYGEYGEHTTPQAGIDPEVEVIL